MPKTSDGLYEYKYFDDYWTDDSRTPYLIYVGNDIAGFALVRQLGNQTFQIAEFYIAPEYRGSGIGKQSAIEIFNKLRGAWHVVQEEKYIPAQKFWRNTIDSYTDGKYKEEKSESQPYGPKQIFVNQ